MKTAYTGWTWLVNHKDNPLYEIEQFLAEMADLKYDAVENFAFITDYFDDPADAKALLDKYGLPLVNLYHGYSGDFEVDYQKAERYVAFMKAVGVPYLNLQCPCWSEPPLERPTDEETIRKYAELSNRIGKLCVENGQQACFHPHAQSAVFTEEQIELFVKYSDPALVGLCLDTAHTTIAGMDAVRAFEKFASRITYVHLKDVAADLNGEFAGRQMARFRPLGVGVVDFVGVVNVLKKAGYDGVLCVELDRPLVCNYKSAMISRNYLHDVLGL